LYISNQQWLAGATGGVSWEMQKAEGRMKKRPRSALKGLAEGGGGLIVGQLAVYSASLNRRSSMGLRRLNR